MMDLFYADFEAYRKLGQSISGQEYIKRDYGPCPKQFVPVTNQMNDEGLSAWAVKAYPDDPTKKLKKLTVLQDGAIDTRVFTGPELEIIDSMIDYLWPMNATEVSDLSHSFAGWQAAGFTEAIPYNTVFVGQPRPLSAEEIDWAQEVVDEYGADSADHQAAEV